MIRNYMEDAVNHLLPSILNEYSDICKCSKCIEDIKAMALNKLKPLYSVTDEGTLYLKIDEMQQQFKADVMQEIIKSIEIVSKNPKHSL